MASLSQRRSAVGFSAVGQNAAPGAAHPKRSQTSTTDSSVKEDGGVQLRKPSTPGSRGAPPSSPLLGNANNPNKADIPDRRKGVATGPSVSPPSLLCPTQAETKPMNVVCFGSAE